MVMKTEKKAFGIRLHVMAQVLEQMYPGVKLTLGPAISNGFYYDIDFEDQKITEADFKKKDSILEISRGKHEFKLRPVSKTDALELLQRQRLQNRDDHQS
jgi:threonyl-tRNA synthetase